MGRATCQAYAEAVDQLRVEERYLSKACIMHSCKYGFQSRNCFLASSTLFELQAKSYIAFLTWDDGVETEDHYFHQGELPDDKT